MDEDERERDGHSEVAAEFARIRALILARRSRFLAAALVGVGMTGGCATSNTCLRPNRKDAADEADGGQLVDAATPDGESTSGTDGGGTRPDAAAPADAGVPAQDAGGAGHPADAAPDARPTDEDAGPRVCLTPI